MSPSSAASRRTSCSRCWLASAGSGSTTTRYSPFAASVHCSAAVANEPPFCGAVYQWSVGVVSAPAPPPQPLSPRVPSRARQRSCPTEEPPTDHAPAALPPSDPRQTGQRVPSSRIESDGVCVPRTDGDDAERRVVAHGEVHSPGQHDPGLPGTARVHCRWNPSGSLRSPEHGLHAAIARAVRRLPSLDPLDGAGPLRAEAHVPVECPPCATVDARRNDLALVRVEVRPTPSGSSWHRGRIRSSASSSRIGVEPMTASIVRNAGPDGRHPNGVHDDQIPATCSGRASGGAPSATGPPRSCTTSATSSVEFVHHRADRGARALEAASQPAGRARASPFPGRRARRTGNRSSVGLMTSRP